MIAKIQNLINGKTTKQLLDIRNIVLYVFGVVVLAIAWSGAKTVQNNYDLQKQIARLQQENDVLSLQNQNAELQNQYYQTDQYLELSARQNLGLAAPGETVLIVPQATALKYIDPTIGQAAVSSKKAVLDHRSRYVKNLESWRDFLLGRRATSG